MSPNPNTSSLTHRAGRAVGFRLSSSLVNVLFGLGVGVILARLLSPEEFGMFAVAIGIVSLVEIVSSGGMLEALVQRKTVIPEDEFTATVLQLAWALILGAGLVLAGPVIEKFFGFTGLCALIQLQAVALLTTALSLIPTSRLMRTLSFDRLAVIEVLTRVIEGTVSITLALHGHGVLALAVANITAEACRTGICWALAAGRISLLFRMHSAKTLLVYGTGVICNRTCIAIGRRADILIVGHRLGPDVVGVYQRAYQLVTLPLWRFTNAANEALFPAMAKIQDEDQRFRQGFLGTVGLTSIVTFPFLTLLWASADLLIPLLYGPKWNGTVPILMSLGFVGYIRSVNSANGTVAKARGRVMIEAMYQAITMILLVVFVFLGSYLGIQAVVIGVGMASLLSLFFMTRLALSVSGVSFLQWLGALRTTLVSSAAMGFIMVGLKAILIGHMPALFLLLTISFFGVVTYMICLGQFITTREFKLLERILPLLPLSLRNLLLLCISSRAKLIYE